MEKRVWTKPLAKVEMFEANEYIAKCDDLVNNYYNFKCDAGRYGKYNTVYYETTGNNQLDTGFWGDYHRTDSYYPCDIEHRAKVGETEFLDGYVITGYSSSGYKYDKVVIWEGPDNDNVHCTYSLVDEIEIVKGNKS